MPLQQNKFHTFNKMQCCVYIPPAVSREHCLHLLHELLLQQGQPASIVKCITISTTCAVQRTLVMCKAPPHRHHHHDVGHPDQQASVAWQPGIKCMLPMMNWISVVGVLRSELCNELDFCNLIRRLQNGMCRLPRRRPPGASPPMSRPTVEPAVGLRQ